MELSHVHVHVRDLTTALAWFREKLEATPVYSDTEMAVLRFGCADVILDVGDADDRATIALHADDCDAAFAALVARGAEVVEAPADKPYGVRSAYLRGPGGLKIELEQPLRR